VQFPIIIGLHRSLFLNAIFLLLAFLSFTAVLEGWPGFMKNSQKIGLLF